MTRTSSVVTLEVAKQGAIYHGLATLLNQPSPMMQRGERSRRSLARRAASARDRCRGRHLVLIAYRVPGILQSRPLSTVTKLYGVGAVPILKTSSGCDPLQDSQDKSLTTVSSVGPLAFWPCGGSLRSCPPAPPVGPAGESPPARHLAVVKQVVRDVKSSKTGRILHWKNVRVRVCEQLLQSFVC